MTDNELETQLRELKSEIAKLNAHRFVNIHNSIYKLLGFQFLRGLAFGLGSVLGATVLVSILVYFLSQIDFIPIIGEWARDILEILKPVGE